MQSNLFETSKAQSWEPPHDLPNIKHAKIISIDTETFDPYIKERGPGYIRKDGYLLGVSVATDDGYKKYFPIRHKQGGNIDPEIMRRWLNDQLSGNQLKIGHNIDYDLGWLKSDGISVNGPFYCTMLAAKLVDENESASLDAVSKRMLGVAKNDEQIARYIADRFGGNADRENYGGKIFECPAEIVGPYAESDAALPIAIYHEQRKIIAQEELGKVCDLEMGLIPMIQAMKWRGIRVDLEKAHYVKQDTKQRLSLAYSTLEKLTWPGFSAGSSDDIAKAFDAQKISYGQTEKGNAEFTQGFLKRLNHPIADAILEFRKLQKFDSTFIDAVINYNINGRIHTQLNQIGAVTRRFSSSNPNLQNLPARDDEFGPLVRSLFLPEENEELYSFDYSQIEYRYLVHLGNDDVAKKLKQAYLENPDTDIHQFVSDWLGMDRKPGKNLNFGIVYGLGLMALARSLARSVEDTKALRAEYDKKFPFASALMEKAKERVNKTGYIKTLLGARRRFDKWEPCSWNDRKGCKPLNKSEAESKWGKRIQRAYGYSGLNAAIQGSAADIIKQAMLNLHTSGNSRIAIPLMTIHDELLFSFPLTELTKNDIIQVKEIMESCVKLSLPLKVDMAKGKNWGELL